MDRHPLKVLPLCRQPLLKIHMGIEILEVKVGMEMSGAALVIEMLDTLVVMGMAMLDIT